jgi:tetratricopeptide (TPR) repeat protein
MCVDTGVGLIVSTLKRAGLLAVPVLAAALLSTGCSGGGLAMTKAAPAATNTAIIADHTGVGESASPLAVEEIAVSGDAMQRFNVSKSAMAQNSWKVAEEGLLSLAHDYPELSGPSLNLALVYRQVQDNRQAEHWFKQSISRNKNNLLAYNQYGIFLREQGRFEQAEDTYQQALFVSEADADTHLNLGILYDLYRGDKKAALQHFSRYQELQESDDRVVAGWIVDLERQLNSVAVAE